jgi:NADPH-dependent 2,4-dienoyl-CoA reductase/sulfur reductase-like enzyme/pSer/pThr/pTyr-binding forkhead associated (FHA) protein
MARKRYLIVGDGAAGLTAAEEIRRRDPDGAIGIFCDEPNPGYFRAALTNFLLGELREDQLWSVAPDFYASRRIERVFTRVLRVDAARREVWCSGNPAPLGYDALLVASGARARPPAFPGSHLPGVLTLRTIQDARRIVDVLRGQVRSAVVLGGGALGLEWTHALLERGVKVTLLERAPRFMPNALDAVASDLLAARLGKAGVDVLLGEEVAQLEMAPNGGVGALVTRSGRRIVCELAAAALGIVPNSELLSDVARTASGALQVDRSLATSAPGVWAAGDVASVDGEQLGLWEPARHQGRVAAANMCGAAEQYRPGAHYFATRLFDLDFARVGDIAETAHSRTLVDFPRGTGHIAYRKLVVEHGRVKGALLIGERQARVRAIGRGLKRLLDARADVTNVAERLLDPSFDVAGFLETRKLLEKPPVERTTQAVPEAAKLRGTQALGIVTAPIPSVPASSASAPAQSGGTSILPSAPRSTRLLSIGLPAEAAPAAQASPSTIDAWFELAGHSFRLAGKLSSIGSAPESSVRVGDPSVAHLHAQVAQHGSALFLRDAGTQTGTWVNGVPLAGAHALRDGDRVLVGRCELVFRSSALGATNAGSEAMIALPRLEVRSGPSSGLSFVLSTDAASIGSERGADLLLCDPSVAPLHARVRLAGGQHYLSDLGSPSGSYARGGRLQPGQELALAEGESFQLGAVALAYTRAPTRDRVAAFRPMAKLVVTSGAGLGRSASFSERILVGSAPAAQLCLPDAAPHELEVLCHEGQYFARDFSGGRTFKSGAPLGSEWARLGGGELLLLSSGALLRFEEA